MSLKKIKTGETSSSSKATFNQEVSPIDDSVSQENTAVNNNSMQEKQKNEPYIVQFVVNRATNEVTSADVLYSLNAKTNKKESAGSLSPEIADLPATLTDSAISISNLLEYVNKYFPDILPEDVLKHFGHTERPNGKLGESALFSQREKSIYEKVGESKKLLYNVPYKLDPYSKEIISYIRGGL